MFAGGAIRHHVDHALQIGATPDLTTVLSSASGVAVPFARLGDCHSADPLVEWLERFGRDWGFPCIRYVHLGHRPPGSDAIDRPPVRYVSTQGAELDPWRAGDPAAARAAQSFLPSMWTTRDDAALPDAQRSWLSVERVRGVEAGIAIPIQDYLAGPAHLSLIGQSEARAAALIEAHAQELLLTAVHFHIQAKQVLPTIANVPGAMTDRELGCLRLAATGATLSETASALGIAARTVELHVGNAARKLGARNKMHSVAIAVSTGLIQV